ncbi:hypothetical protein XACS581_3540002 [Xanthomonas citri pv. citri]|nr:hypothetical protein XACS581_3540002 [Xanthomonas citri pv. citri]
MHHHPALRGNVPTGQAKSASLGHSSSFFVTLNHRAVLLYLVRSPRLSPLPATILVMTLGSLWPCYAGPPQFLDRPAYWRVCRFWPPAKPAR